MKFVLASNNQKKLKEMRAILENHGVEVISQSEAGVSEDPEETGDTFFENALIKARAVMEASGLPAIADDSGLCVDRLSGEPGVRSARYGGGLPDAERCLLLLKNLGDTEQRSARFVSCIACAFPNGDVISAEGKCEGSILREPAGENGFGYDPIFYVPELGKSFAQLTAEEKNSVSHRGRSIVEFVKELERYYADK